MRFQGLNGAPLLLRGASGEESPPDGTKIEFTATQGNDPEPC